MVTKLNDRSRLAKAGAGRAPKAKRHSLHGRMGLFDYVNYLFIGLLCVVFLYPVILTLSMSVSDPLSYEKVTLLPKGFSLDSYLFLLKDPRIMRYYFNSVFYAVAGTLIHLLLTSLCAYPMMIPQLRGKKFIHIFMVVTMYFGGGLIPTYYVVRAVGLIDNVLVFLIPGAVGAYTVIIFRTFFMSIPTELRESAFIDGAGHTRVLFTIVLPLSKAMLATFGLFSLVGRWNDYFTALIYMRSDALMPMQILLRKMLVLLDFRDTENMALQMLYTRVTSRTMKSAAVIITILPILCAYPFLQKYFAKGALVGSLKL